MSTPSVRSASTGQVKLVSVRLEENGGVWFAGPGNRLSGMLEFPSLPGIPRQPFAFRLEGEATTRWGGMDVLCETYGSVHPGLTVRVELLHSCDGVVAGLRMGCENTGSAPLELTQLHPLTCRGSEAVLAGGAALGDWRAVRMSRQKNDIPGSYRPAVRDSDYAQALLDGTDITAGRGVSAEAAVRALRNSLTVKCDPCLILKNTRREDLPGLFLGFAGQTEHLSHLELTPEEDRPELRELRAVADFDGALLPPGACRHTHWLLFCCGTNEQELLRNFAGRLAAEYPPCRKHAAPVIFCSWYFYGLDFLEADLEENLRELRTRPLEIDTFLIDNGWMDDYGSYQANGRFPGGMRQAAEAIRAAGYQPGIWTCPFVVSGESKALKRWPQMLARQEDGELCNFPLAEGGARVIDPTHPQGEEYLREVFSRLKRWGYTAHKLDYLRALIVNPQVRFHDRTATRAQAYRRGMEIIRQTLGDDCYILACGGLYEGTTGVADGNRIGCDVKGRWREPAGSAKAKSSFGMGHMVRIKQNFWRNYTNLLWHTDPDALQLRRRNEPFRGQEEFFHLSEGGFNDDEAFSCVVNQYLGGGLVCVSERMAELPEDRRELMRRIMPACTEPAEILDPATPDCPELLRTRVRTPFGEWQTLAVFNWSDEVRQRAISLKALDLPAGEYVVFDQGQCEQVGITNATGEITLEIPAHGCRLLRICRRSEDVPVLAGTDGHLSGGAAELADFNTDAGEVRWTISPQWRRPLTLFVLYPGETLPRRLAVQLSQQS